VCVLVVGYLYEVSLTSLRDLRALAVRHALWNNSPTLEPADGFLHGHQFVPLRNHTPYLVIVLLLRNSVTEISDGFDFYRRKRLPLIMEFDKSATASPHIGYRMFPTEIRGKAVLAVGVGGVFGSAQRTRNGYSLGPARAGLWSEAAFKLRDAVTSQTDARILVIALSEVNAIEGAASGCSCSCDDGHETTTSVSSCSTPPSLSGCG
jgi:hypothetical protein